MLAYDGCQLIDVTGVLEIFVYASDLLRQRCPDAPPFYSVEILAERKGRLKTSSGIKLVADRSYRDAGEEIDTLLIAGAIWRRSTDLVAISAQEPGFREWRGE